MNVGDVLFSEGEDNSVLENLIFIVAQRNDGDGKVLVFWCLEDSRGWTSSWYSMTDLGNWGWKVKG